MKLLLKQLMRGAVHLSNDGENSLCGNVNIFINCQFSAIEDSPTNRYTWIWQENRKICFACEINLRKAEKPTNTKMQAWLNAVAATNDGKSR